MAPERKIFIWRTGCLSDRDLPGVLFVDPYHDDGAAFFLLAGLIALVLAMSAQFSRRAPAAAWLCAPYLLWLLFAAYLNLGVWLLNR